MVRSETRIDSLIIAKWKNQCEARAGQEGGLALVKLWNYVSPEFVSKDLNTEAPSWEQDKLFSTCFTTRVSRAACYLLSCHWFSDPSHVSPWLILIFVFYAEKNIYVRAEKIFNVRAG